MRKIFQMLFQMYVAPAFGLFVFGAASITVLGVTRQADGTARVRAKATLDNAYPVAGYDFSPQAIKAALGFTNYRVQDNGAGFVDPVVTGVNQQGLIFEFVNLKLLCSYPTGGSVASPATPAAPVGATGGTAVTSSAATLPVTPGVGKACVNNTDLSNASIVVFFDAFGYTI